MNNLEKQAIARMEKILSDLPVFSVTNAIKHELIAAKVDENVIRYSISKGEAVLDDIRKGIYELQDWVKAIKGEK